MAPLRNPFDGMKPCGLIVSFNRGNRKVWKRNPTQTHLRPHSAGDGAARTDSADAPKILPKSASPSAHLSLEKTKIAAVTAAAQCCCARKAELAQSAVGHVIHVAKQWTQLRTAVFPARRVPEALANRRRKVRFVVFLCALPQVGGTHYLEKAIAVNPIKSRHRLHFHRKSVLFCCHPVHHVRPHVRKGFLRRQLCLQHLVQRNARQNGLHQCFHVVKTVSRPGFRRRSVSEIP